MRDGRVCVAIAAPGTRRVADNRRRCPGPSRSRAPATLAMAHGGGPGASATSPKTRLHFLLDEAPPPRLPDRGRARDAVRALSADGALGAPPAPAPPPMPSPPRSLDWLPGARAHSPDSFSSSGSADLAGAALARDDSSDAGSASGSASGASPRLRTLPAPALLPAAHLLQASAYGGVLAAYAAPSTGAPLAPLRASHAGAGPAAPRIAPAPASSAARARARVGDPKSEAAMRERHDQRKMKNRISAAASRDRKKRSFNNLQRSLHDAELRFAEAKRVIETLTLQLEHARSRMEPVQVPQDLRHLCNGAEYLSPQQLVELLRVVASNRR